MSKLQCEPGRLAPRLGMILPRLLSRGLLECQFEVKLSLCAVLALWIEATIASATTPVSFNKDIAPIVFENCASCHRPGESGPFPLLSYNDVKKRARQIAEVTEKRYMPPWLPDGPHGQFVGDRRLSREQIELFRQWYDAGTPEGPGDLPPMPHWPGGWHLGDPDLVVQMAQPFILAAEGRDVYRNFVLPVALSQTRYVRAVEFRANNPRIVHHAFIKVDYLGRVHLLDGADGEPGFAGMNLPEGVKMPSGYFLSYQPGKLPSSEAAGYGWTLKSGQDLVLQAHLRPSGKPEQLKAQVGLFFTETPPTTITLLLSLGSLNIDIPAGTNTWVLEDSFLLPVPVTLLSVLPHAHYLGKCLEAFACLPDGSQRQLLNIPDWDFNWQGDYRYTNPIRLPAGSGLRMRFVYDNSEANPRNPNHPPKEVMYGPQSSDEMAECWFQVQLSSTNDEVQLSRAYDQKERQILTEHAQSLLQRDPHDARARTELGFLHWTDGKVDQAVQLFHAACADDPTYDQPHYYLGVIYREQNRLVAARAEFEIAVRLNRDNPKSLTNLALVFLGLGNLDRAERSIREAVRLDPTDGLARETLDNILQMRNKGKP